MNTKNNRGGGESNRPDAQISGAAKVSVLMNERVATLSARIPTGERSGLLTRIAAMASANGVY
jgi:hypothetical protein